jgi:hypothetical protein
MKKIIIWTSILSIVLIIVLIFGERIFLSLFLKNIPPREPKNQIEETYQIGWWGYQDSMKINCFRVEIIESNLNLFNNYSLVRYTVQGEMKWKNGWKPYIENVHISERFIRKYNRELNPFQEKDTVKTPEAIFEITPIVKTKEDKKYKAETIKFEFTNELKIQSFHWGNNTIRLQCDSLKTDIMLKQTK